MSEGVVEDTLVVGSGGGEVGVGEVEEKEAGGVQGETLQGGEGREGREVIRFSTFKWALDAVLLLLS